MKIADAIKDGGYILTFISFLYIYSLIKDILVLTFLILSVVNVGFRFALFTHFKMIVIERKIKTLDSLGKIMFKSKAMWFFAVMATWLQIFAIMILQRLVFDPYSFYLLLLNYGSLAYLFGLLFLRWNTTKKLIKGTKK